MALRKCLPSGHPSFLSMAPSKFSNTVHEEAQYVEPQSAAGPAMEDDVEIDLSEVYFLIMHFLSAGPCQRTVGQFWNELLEHRLLPRRYHAWYSRSGAHSGDENDNSFSFPLNYNKLVERYPHVKKDHLVKLLKQLILSTAPPVHGMAGGNAPNAADVPTLLGSGSFSLLESFAADRNREAKQTIHPPRYLRWPHMHADQVRGLSLREIGGGFSKHHRAPSVRAACYAIAKPSTMVQRMQNIKKLRGHRDAVYCAILDRSGRYLITGADDRLVKIWSMETAFCLVSCRGHEGDITDLAVSSNNAWVASSANDFIIRVWRLPDGLPIAVLRGHTAAVTAIAFSPRPSASTQLLSSSDDGTCRIWDIRNPHIGPRVYVPKPLDVVAGKGSGPSSSNSPQSNQILCCAYNANGTVFVTGSSDTFARVWNACKSSADDSEQPNHEMDVLSGHENDVNYVQFSGCAIPSKFCTADTSIEENVPKFKNSWFTRDNIVTCSRDGSAIIWTPKSRRSHSKVGRWSRAYHLKVPPPPMPPQPPRGGPRQRALPTPRGVNMIVWSLDNRFVLAAIMDCRICVWNAADGSLVHSLTGHSESTYVLDVHPFNPRVAMSAGYDGKTIVWDIWEGTPIRIYELGRFKLVDGKFSSDGTSIILSDDVGQIYILNTGQGESQKDAKYDQFFLGDYRPLMQDTHGTMLDQETQLTPYMRNIQDLLCDSSMMPYPEPYQSMYQQRRLGALGIDRRYSSVSFSVGPVDVNGYQDYQMLPLPDLDRIIEPMPEFIDAMDWEPEIEIQSDDNDSEYNVTDEYQSEGEQGSLGTSFSDDSECSADDSEAEHSLKEGRRRSKRKKHKEKAEFMTSSGRRVKRRNLDERDSSSSRVNRTRKTKNGKKRLKKKPSTSKSLRPQRTAARNARHWLSHLKGAHTDEGLGTSEEELSDGESMLSESDFQSNESDRSSQDVYQRNPKGKEVFLDEDVKTELERQKNSTPRKRFVLRLPARDPKLAIPTECMNPEEQKPIDLANSFSGTQEDFEPRSNHLNFQDPGSSLGNLIDAVMPQSEGGEDMLKIRDKSDKVEDHVDLSSECQDKNMKWGEVKARTSKRLRYGEANLGYNGNVDGHDGMRNGGNGHLAPSDDVHESLDDERNRRGKSLLTCDSSFSTENKEQSGPRERRDSDDESLDTKPRSSLGGENGTSHSKEVKEANPPISIKFKIRPKTVVEDPGSSLKQKSVWAVEDRTSSDCELASRDSLHVEGNQVAEVRKENEGNGVSNNRMYNVVYKRSKTRDSSENGGVDLEGSTSNTSNNHLEPRMDFPEATVDVVRRTRSMVIKATTREPDNEFTLRECSRRSSKAGEENWGFNSKVRVGLRSSRNRRENYCGSSLTPLNKRKSSRSLRKLSWLMLSEHEENYRYIPQLGDKVAYLRQGHEGYIEWRRSSKERGPWTRFEGVKAVEFCRVEALDYSTFTGSGESCCNITLEFIDSCSSVCGQTFKLTLPELTDYSDFLVEQTRYDASMSRNWTKRDKCRVWWREDNEEGGSWYSGRVVLVQPVSQRFLDSPWERYAIQYPSDANHHLHSPWELHDVDALWYHPHIDDEMKTTVLSAIVKLEQHGIRNQDRYGLEKLEQVSEKSDFLNRFPVPLTLELIQARLENNYYRSLDAVKHDFTVMLSNAQSYFSKNENLKVKLRRLSDWFDQKILQL